MLGFDCLLPLNIIFFVKPLLAGALTLKYFFFKPINPIVNQRKCLCQKCAQIEFHVWSCQLQSFSVLYQKPLTWIPFEWKMRLKGGWNMQRISRWSVFCARKCRICHRTMRIIYPGDMTPFIVGPLTCHKHPNTIWISSLFSRFSFESSKLTSSPSILDVATARAAAEARERRKFAIQIIVNRLIESGKYKIRIKMKTNLDYQHDPPHMLEQWAIDTSFGAKKTPPTTTGEFSKLIMCNRVCCCQPE